MKSLYSNCISSRDTSVLISSTLADRLPACAVLWWYSRAIDASGSGKATFTVRQAASDIGRDIQTIKRYLEDGAKAGLFRFARRSNGLIEVYYTALTKVALRRGYESLGTFFKVTVDQLPHLKAIATEAQAASLQRQSHHEMVAALKKEQQTKRVKFNTTADIFDQAPSVVCRGGNSNVIFIGKRAVFVSQKFTVFGGSQKAIATQLDRSERTIQRRLSNTWRDRKGLDRVEKKQVCQLQDSIASDWKGLTKSALESGEFDIAAESARLFNIRGKVFKSCCNLYSFGLELVPRKALKKVFGRLLSKQYRT